MSRDTDAPIGVPIQGDFWVWHGTIGWFARENGQLLGRWDSMRPDGPLPDSDLLIVGANWWPTALTELQLNLVVPTDDDRGLRVLMNAQVAF